ncbi:lysozyme inhibitor LprI family protein [Bacteroidota bacterium]
MKKIRILVTLFILILPSYTFAQINFDNPPWEIRCDTMMTQTDMNICAYESFCIADSILSQTYKKIENELIKALNIEKANKTSEADSSSVRRISLIKKQLIILAESKLSFCNYRDHMVSLVELQYQGGSMQSLMMNALAIELTVPQIKALTELTNY